MSLLLDALRQAEKNKADQNKQEQETELEQDLEARKTENDFKNDDEGLVELDVLPEFDLTEEEVTIDGGDFKLEENNKFSADVIELESVFGEAQQQRSSHTLSLEEHDVSSGFEAEELVEISENSNDLSLNELSEEGHKPKEIDLQLNEGQDEFLHNIQLNNEGEGADPPGILTDNNGSDTQLSSVDGSLAKKAETSNLVDIKATAIVPGDIDSQQKEPLTKPEELDEDAVNVLQTNQSANKKTLYWLSALFFIILFCIAAYFYILSTPNVTHTQIIDDSIEDTFMLDNSADISNPTNSHDLQDAKQKVTETESNKAGPVLSVMAGPEKATTTQHSQSITKEKPTPSSPPKKITKKSASPAFFVEEDELNIDYPKKIRIQIKRQQPTVVRDLFKAYSLYSKQDYFAAKLLYKQVLRDDPINIDALLGLAAIAEQFSRVERAKELFEKILDINGNHIIANNGLIRLQKGQNPAENESQYKSMIEKFPDSAEAYAALGNLYISKKQWHDAQDVYFKAVEQSPESAYYHFNLAVSLDHLSKVSPAIRYYQNALQLSHENELNFDRRMVEKRIEQLQSQKQ